MRRRLFTLAATLSAVPCVGVCGLWVRSDRRPAGAEDQVAVRHRRTGDRLTVRSCPGRLVLFAPPRPPAGTAPTRAPDGQTAESLAAGLANDGLAWWAEFERSESNDGHEVWTPASLLGPDMADGARRLLEGHRFQFDSPATVFPKGELAAPLLRALDDPRRFAAAHAVLALAFDPPPGNGLEVRPGGSYARAYRGLRADLTPDPRVGPEYVWVSPGGVVRHEPCTARIDPAQLPALRDEWHRRLDGRPPPSGTGRWPPGRPPFRPRGSAGGGGGGPPAGRAEGAYAGLAGMTCGPLRRKAAPS